MMDADQPATTVAPPSMAQPAANASPFVPNSVAEGSVSQNRVAERSILDEDVPILQEQAIEPIKIPTMLPRDGGLATSRWAPRMTLDGREIED
jgi:hypothetical protein